MATISEIRDGIATNLTTITGLRTTETVPDNPQPPVAIIQPNAIEYDRAFQRGLDQYNFTVTVIVGRASERQAQRLLDLYCAGTGSSSVKTAIESNRTLSGVIQDLRVTAMRNYGTISLGDQTYLAAEFDLIVYTQ
jgi:hypothetical protein